jgi:hypothetical protein
MGPRLRGDDAAFEEAQTLHTPSIPLERRAHFVGEGAEGAGEILCGHA